MDEVCYHVTARDTSHGHVVMYFGPGHRDPARQLAREALSARRYGGSFPCDCGDSHPADFVAAHPAGGPCGQLYPLYLRE